MLPFSPVRVHDTHDIVLFQIEYKQTRAREKPGTEKEEMCLVPPTTRQDCTTWYITE